MSIRILAVGQEKRFALLAKLSQKSFDTFILVDVLVQIVENVLLHGTFSVNPMNGVGHILSNGLVRHDHISLLDTRTVGHPKIVF